MGPTACVQLSAMSRNDDYENRLNGQLEQTGIARLSPEQHKFIEEQARIYRFSFQELRQLGEICTDLQMWGEPPIEQLWSGLEPPSGAGKAARQQILQQLQLHRQRLREMPNHYPESSPRSPDATDRIRRVTEERPQLGLGWCPVASSRTRCCNLLTLDAVQNCGFDCSYCSIQSFYHGDEVRFDASFAQKLERLEIDPQKIYHIGTGQSSDSLMWGNQAGILDALMAFARRHPNVILELKTKSKNIAYLLKNDIPANVLCTWSLNPQTLIDNEEHLTASLEERLAAARRLADRGILVGFHFHPMIHYDRWREEYGAIFSRLVEVFDPAEVALVSLGTLTYIKSVLKKLRGREGLRSQILKMPMVEAAGKLSYPDAIKIEMFSHAYTGLTPWHDQVFFYLCMESPTLWQPVFGFEYADNGALEQVMKQSYLAKIEQRRRGIG